MSAIAMVFVKLGADRAGLVVEAAAADAGGGVGRTTLPDAGGGGDHSMGKKGWWSDRRRRLPSSAAAAADDNSSRSTTAITKPPLVPMVAAPGEFFRNPTINSLFENFETSPDVCFSFPLVARIRVGGGEGEEAASPRVANACDIGKVRFLPDDHTGIWVPQYFLPHRSASDQNISPNRKQAEQPAISACSTGTGHTKGPRAPQALNPLPMTCGPRSRRPSRSASGLPFVAVARAGEE